MHRGDTLTTLNVTKMSSSPLRRLNRRGIQILRRRSFSEKRSSRRSGMRISSSRYSSGSKTTTLPFPQLKEKQEIEQKRKQEEESRSYKNFMNSDDFKSNKVTICSSHLGSLLTNRMATLTWKTTSCKAIYSPDYQVRQSERYVEC